MSSSVFQIDYSTILNKSVQASDLRRQEESQKISKRFQSAIVKNPQSQNPQNKTADLRDSLVVSDLRNFNLKVAKKGKRGGNLVMRDMGLPESQSEPGLVQKIPNKSYSVPTEFWPETKNEYNAKVSTKELRNKTLPWNGSALSAFEYRIAFSRSLQQGGGGIPDSAFYFTNKDEWTKAKDFLRVYSILDSQKTSNTPSDPRSVLLNLSKKFKSHALTNLQQLISKRAQHIREEKMKLRQNLLLNSNFLNNLDQSLVSKFNQRWVDHAHGIRISHEEQRYAGERLERIKESVENSPLINMLNAKMSFSLLANWKNQAELLTQNKKEDINIVFNTLEITSQITQPILKIGITVGQDFPGLIKINGVSVYKRNLEYTLKCKYDQVKSYDIYRWKIFSEGAHASETQRGLLQKHDSVISTDLTEGQFCIQFDSFELNYLDSVQLKLMLFNETETLKGYHYASLRDFYVAGQRGNNIWFSMKLSHLEKAKFPLINARVKTSKTNTSQQQSLVNYELADAFFDYSFEFPHLTPKHARILDLCPISWNISDETIGNLRNQRKYNEYLQRVVRKLSKHYYNENSKQLARLKASAYIWADLQDAILDYKSSQHDCLYLKGENIQTALETINQKSHRESASNSTIISYLFKRDLWEVKSEWRPFYNELKTLFKKGIPAQQRTHLWSEISKTAYFLNLTEKAFPNLIGSDLNEDVQTKSKRLYAELKKESGKIYTESAQEFEDDVEYLKQISSNNKKLSFENHLRNVCKTFIYWSKVVNKSVYSRSVLVLCQALLTCQNCSYLDGGSTNEEHQIFWLLVSLTNYVLASYYTIEQSSSPFHTPGPNEINLSKPSSSSKTSITGLPLISNSVSGIRSDLLLLRILLSSNEKELFNKFHEFGTPLEFYFADHILTLFYNLFNPGLTFRIWDIVFFEGTSFNKLKTSRLVVSILYAFIKQCKEQLLEAKKSSDFKMIFELNGKFLTKYGDFIKEIYNVYDTFFATDTVSWSEGGIKSLFKIQCLNVADMLKVGDAEKHLTEIEKVLVKHFDPTAEQNKILHKLLKSKCQQGLSYSKLYDMITSLHIGFGDDKPVAALKKSFSRGQITSLHVKVHSIKTPYGGGQNEKLKIQVGCGGQTQSKEDVKPLKTNFEVEISLQEQVSQFITLEIFDSQKRLLSSKVDLRGFPLNTVTKLVVKLDEEHSEIYNPNHTSSEAEISILLDATEPRQKSSQDSRFGSPFVLPELQSDEKMFKKTNLEKTSLPQAIGGNTIHLEEYAKYSIFSRNKHQWKERFALTFDEFKMVMKEIDQSWFNDESELSQVYNAFVNANINKKFYLINFFILLIFNGNFSLSQKYDLIFYFIAGFDHVFEKDTNSVPSYVMKSLLDDIYEMFMIYIPQNELENMVDLEMRGHTCSIKKVSISGNFSIKVNYPRSMLNKLSNFTQVYYNCREIHLYNKEVLKLLKEVYEKSLVAHPNHLLTHRNEIEITYHTNGMSHKTVIPVDQNWNIIEDAYDIPLSQSMQSKLLYVSRDIIALQHTPYSISKNEFIRVMQRMPLINYVNSFEQIEAPRVLTSLSEIHLQVQIGDDNIFDQVFTRDDILAKEDSEIKVKTGKKRKDLDYYLENWSEVVQYANSKVDKTHYQHGKNSSQKTGSKKFNINISIEELLKSIKKSIIKEISEAVDHNDLQRLQEFDPRIFNEGFWDLDFAASFNINKSNVEFKIRDFKNSTFQLATNYLHQDVTSIQIVYTLKEDTTTTMTPTKNTKKSSWNQLARFRFADNTSEWFPCQIKYRFQASQDSIGYGVCFEFSPQETVLRNAVDVVFDSSIDPNNLELRIINHY